MVVVGRICFGLAEGGVGHAGVLSTATRDPTRATEKEGDVHVRRWFAVMFVDHRLRGDVDKPLS